MRRFVYLRESLFLLGCMLYAINRWVVIPQVNSPFLRNHFNDLLLVPCALPPLLLLLRWLKLREHDGLPGWGEIALYLGVWSVLFEVIGPQVTDRATGDAWDVVAYAAGAAMAALWWNGRALVRLRPAS